MRFKCLFGLHSWNGCTCAHCKATRNFGHDWSQDCEVCSKCGVKARTVIEACPDCGKSYSKWVAKPYCYQCKKYILHDWSSDCEICSKCGKRLEQSHDWSHNCEKCAKCGHTRENSHRWEDCKCRQCGQFRDEYHDWRRNCEKCSICGHERNNSHTLLFKQGCEYQCSACGYSKSIHLYGRCTCEKYNFIRNTFGERVKEQDLLMIRTKLYDLKIQKHNRENDYFQFTIDEIHNLPFLLKIKFLYLSNPNFYAIHLDSHQGMNVATEGNRVLSKSRKELSQVVLLFRMSHDKFTVSYAPSELLSHG